MLYKRIFGLDKEYLQTIQTSHGSDTEMSTSSESLLAVTVSPSPSQISGAVSANSQSNIHTTLIVTGMGFILRTSISSPSFVEFVK